MRNSAHTSTPNWDAAFDERQPDVNRRHFSELLHVGRPNYGNLELFFDKVRDIFDRRWFTNNGHYVQEFERRLSKFLGVKHCIPVCNATLGLSVAAMSMKLSGEVIVPSFTFVATPHSLLWQGVRPVFCDIDPLTHNLDPKKVAELITENTSAVLGVHVWGRSCCTEELESLCRQRGLKLLFDASHAFNCSYRGRMIGNFGDAEVFSFHATKFFNTFEGGAIATNCDELAKRIRLAINFGFSGLDSVSSLGINAKMTEISAAMGITSLESLSAFVERNYQNFLLYRDKFSNIPGFGLVDYDQSESNNFQYVAVEIDETEAGFSRDDLLGFLHSRGVMARRYFYPGCHAMEPYLSQHPARADLSHTKRLCHRVMQFPNGTAVDSEDIRSICSLIKTLQNQRRLR